MATYNDIISLAVTPVNFEEIIERSAFSYTVERLKEIRAEAKEHDKVAFVCFTESGFYHKEEGVGLAIHDSL